MVGKLAVRKDFEQHRRRRVVPVELPALFKRRAHAVVQFQITQNEVIQRILSGVEFRYLFHWQLTFNLFKNSNR